MWWDKDGTTDPAIQPDNLLDRSRHYAERHGASAETLASLAAFLRDPVTRSILALREEQLEGLLVNDAYKPRMHKLYSLYMTGVLTDFELSVRRTPVPLAQIRQEDPVLWQRFLRACTRRLGAAPYPPAVVSALHAHFAGFECPEEMLRRAERDGVAPLSWEEMDGQPVAFSHGPIEASSHVETTLTQLVQEVTVAAQIRSLERQHGLRLSPTELFANSLAKLALGAAQLQREAAEQARAAAAVKGEPHTSTPALMLFAGRRSTSRRFLLLQNWYCMHHLPNYQGTSAVLAVTLLDQLLQAQLAQQAGHAHQAQQGKQHQQQQQHQQGRSQQAQQPELRLVGTLAHEVMMVTDQLLGSFNDITSSTTGSTSGSPVQVSALLAHLLLLASGGGVGQATALCDTFGTRGFVSAALAARLPEEFRRDVQQQYPDQWAALPQAVRAEGSLVFDLFSWWRMDSGSYEEMASYVVGAWERRWQGVAPEQRPPRPRLMHSNLESWDEIVSMWRLPPRIRPAAFAFGTLADGFLPFDCPASGLEQGTDGDSAGNGARGGGDGASSDGSNGASASIDQSASARGRVDQAVEIKLCSVVMKAVQSRHPQERLPRSTESAGKLGDDKTASKALFDRRLPPEAVERTRQRLLLLSKEHSSLDSGVVSAALAAAYHAVTREGVLR